MFNLSYTSPCEIQGVIKVFKPIWNLGDVTDVDGNEWNVRGIINNEKGYFVQAVSKNQLHPYFCDTSGGDYMSVNQTWKPYKVEVIKK
jgi:hypothetical protein|tara:strand:- start:1204 stop:1467 length:264 start_codon:yes stop_codon:yes gene_type:complete